MILRSMPNERLYRWTQGKPFGAHAPIYITNGCFIEAKGFMRKHSTLLYTTVLIYKLCFSYYTSTRQNILKLASDISSGVKITISRLVTSILEEFLKELYTVAENISESDDPFQYFNPRVPNPPPLPKMLQTSLRVLQWSISELLLPVKRRQSILLTNTTMPTVAAVWQWKVKLLCQ